MDASAWVALGIAVGGGVFSTIWWAAKMDGVKVEIGKLYAAQEETHRALDKLGNDVAEWRGEVRARLQALEGDGK